VKLVRDLLEDLVRFVRVTKQSRKEIRKEEKNLISKHNHTANHDRLQFFSRKPSERRKGGNRYGRKTKK